MADAGFGGPRTGEHPVYGGPDDVKTGEFVIPKVDDMSQTVETPVPDQLRVKNISNPTLSKLFELPAWDPGQTPEARAAYVAETMNKARLASGERRLIYSPQEGAQASERAPDEVAVATQAGYLVAEDRLASLAKDLSQGVATEQRYIQEAMGEIPDVSHLVNANQAWDVAEAGEVSRQQSQAALEISAASARLFGVPGEGKFQEVQLTPELLKEAGLAPKNLWEKAWGGFKRSASRAYEATVRFVDDAFDITYKANLKRSQQEGAMVADQAKHALEALKNYVPSAEAPQIQSPVAEVPTGPGFEPQAWGERAVTAQELESMLGQLGYSYEGGTDDEPEGVEEAREAIEALHGIEELSEEGEELIAKLRRGLEARHPANDDTFDQLYQEDAVLARMDAVINETSDQNASDMLKLENKTLTGLMREKILQANSLRTLADTIGTTQVLGWSADDLHQEFLDSSDFRTPESFEPRTWVQEQLVKELGRPLDAVETKFLARLVERVFPQTEAMKQAA